MTYIFPQLKAEGLSCFTVLRKVLSPKKQIFGLTKQVFGLTNQVFGLTNQVLGPRKQVFGLTNQVFGPWKQVFGLTKLAFGWTKQVFGLTKHDKTGFQSQTTGIWSKNRATRKSIQKCTFSNPVTEGHTDTPKLKHSIVGSLYPIPYNVGGFVPLYGNRLIVKD